MPGASGFPEKSAPDFVYLVVPRDMAAVQAVGECVDRYAGTVCAPRVARFGEPAQALQAAIALRAALPHLAQASLPVVLDTVLPVDPDVHPLLAMGVAGDICCTPSFQQQTPKQFDPLIWPLAAAGAAGCLVLWQAGTAAVQEVPAPQITVCVAHDGPAFAAVRAHLDPYALTVTPGDTRSTACFAGMRQCLAGIGSLAMLEAGTMAIAVATQGAAENVCSLAAYARERKIAAVFFAVSAAVYLDTALRHMCSRFDTGVCPVPVFALPLKSLRGSRQVHTGVSVPRMHCFYCAGNHATAACPSKHIQDTATVLALLAQRPFAQVRALF